MFLIQKFGDAQLERLYCFKQFQQHSTFLTYLLCTYTAALLLISLNHLANFDLTFIWATVSAGFALGINIWFNVASIKYQKTIITIFKIWLCIITFFAITTNGQQTLLFCIISLFTIYVLLPLNFLWTIFITFLLSLYQIIMLIITFLNTGNQRLIVEELLATVIVHIWTNFIGIYLLAMRNRLSRAAFLNARNALTSEEDAHLQKNKMTSLLSASLPPHIIKSVQNQIHDSVPKIYVEHYAQATVIYAKIYGLQNVLNQLSIQDSARLLNEFNYRIDQLVKGFNFIRIQLDVIIVVAGIPHNYNDEFAIQACYFAQNLIAIFKTFCDATATDVQLKIGISTGEIFSGIIGANKWHYEIIGNAYDSAKSLESQAHLSSIFISESTNRIIEKIFTTEKVDYNAWKILNPFPLLNLFNQNFKSLLFTNTQRRFSSVALPQTINLLLQSSAIVNASIKSNCTLDKNSEFFKPNCVRGRRKRNNIKNNKNIKSAFNICLNNSNLIDDSNDLTQKNEKISLFNPITLNFTEKQLEKNFYAQIDRWFIPGLTIQILFFVVYGLYQMLIISRFFTTLIIMTSAICVLFIILLVLYVNFFENFCQFLTRTSFGYSITIFFIIVLAFLCGIINTFFCNLNDKTQICHKVYYSAISCALWMLSTIVFVRFNSLKLLISFIGGIFFYSIYVFKTHSNLYHEFFIKFGWQIEFDTIIGLLTLGLIIFLQSRQNERLLKIDYLSVLKTIEENNQRERFEYLNEQIIFNALPQNIACNYLRRNDFYQNFHQSVGVLSAKIGQTNDWQGEFGFDRLNKIVFEIDQMLSKYYGLEKVRTAHAIYTCAVGILPNVFEENINDEPCTISNLLASLTNFALNLKTIVNKEGFEIAIGIDCGPAMSLVIGNERPRFELIGTPCSRALELLNFASKIQEAQHKNNDFINKSYKIIASEEIYLALRPRQNTAIFRFDEKNICTVAPGLIGYSVLENENLKSFISSTQNLNKNKITTDSQICLKQKNLTKNLSDNQLKNNLITNFTNNIQNFKTDTTDNNIDFTKNCYEKQKFQNSLNCTKSPSIATLNSMPQIQTLLNPQLLINNKTECLPSNLKYKSTLTKHFSAIEPKFMTASFLNKEKSISNSVLLNKNSLNSSNVSLLPNSLQMSETDFDEIDEHVAAEVCAKEKKFLNESQNNNFNIKSKNEINNFMFDFDNKSFNLPTDLKALANDKRLSGYLSDSKEIKKQNFFKNQKLKRLGQHNPLEMFSSINSSFSSELFSIDISVESDSEIEWITPKMIAALNNKNYNNYNSLNYSKIQSQSSINKQNNNFILSKLIENQNSSQNCIYDQYSNKILERNHLRSSSFSSKMQRKKYHISRNGPKPPDWFSQSGSQTSFGSKFSMSRSPLKKKSILALDQLNAAAHRVNKMLQELACVDEIYLNKTLSNFQNCPPFPTSTTSPSNAFIKLKHEAGNSPQFTNNSNCQTDYDNAESEEFYSDSELITTYNQHKMRNKKLKDFNNKKNCNIVSKSLQKEKEDFNLNNFLNVKNQNKLDGFPPLPPSAQNFVSKRKKLKEKKSSYGLSSAYEADIDSNCSSVASSSTFLNAKNKLLTSLKKSPVNAIKWKSVHSIGYDNEYEFALEDDYESFEFDDFDKNLDTINKKKQKITSPNILLLNSFNPIQQTPNKKLFRKKLNNGKITRMNAIETEDEEINDKLIKENNNYFLLNQDDANKFKKKQLVHEIIDARGQVHAISADICKNFGNFKLSSFSDAEI